MGKWVLYIANIIYITTLCSIVESQIHIFDANLATGGPREDKEGIVLLRLNFRNKEFRKLYSIYGTFIANPSPRIMKKII